MNTRARRREKRNRQWSASWLILAVAAVMAAGLLAGDIWLARSAVVVALVGGVVATTLAWREMVRQRRAAGQDAVVALRRSGDQLHSERVQHLRLLQVLQSRNGDLSAMVLRLRAENAALLQQLASIRGDLTALRLEIVRLTEAHSAEILDLPLRAGGSLVDEEQVLWSDSTNPTVVDLKAVIAPFEEFRQAQA